jgi:hypothetical protein
MKMTVMARARARGGTAKRLIHRPAFCSPGGWRSAFNCALFLLLLHCGPLQADVLARDTITWMEVSMPPYLIQDGSDQNKGYGDLVTGI